MAYNLQSLKGGRVVQGGYSSRSEHPKGTPRWSTTSRDPSKQSKLKDLIINVNGLSANAH